MTASPTEEPRETQERRFQGAMSEDYLLVRQAVPGFERFQNLVADAVAAHPCPDPARPLRVLDLGCGDGVTSATILARRSDIQLTALDSEQGMADRARRNLAREIDAGGCRIVLSDALAWFRDLPAGSFDVVASALALHNLQGDYRHALHREIYRVLGPGGLFANADKFARDEQQRWQRLQLTLEHFFDAFLPSGKLDLLRASVLHEVADEEPTRIMGEEAVLAELGEIGFHEVAVRRPHPLAALLVATK